MKFIKELEYLKKQMIKFFIVVKLKYMKTRNFAIWLQGFLAAIETDHINPNQTEIIKNKLNEIFIHEAIMEEVAENINASISNLENKPEYDNDPGTHVRC